MSKRFTTTLNEDDYGDLILTIPYDIIEELGWSTETELKKVTSKIDPWQDNKEAHEAINMCLEAIVKRLEQIESFVNELPTPDKTYYKPEGHEDYLNTKENYDTIYNRIKILEDKVYGMQRTE